MRHPNFQPGREAPLCANCGHRRVFHYLTHHRIMSNTNGRRVAAVEEDRPCSIPLLRGYCGCRSYEPEMVDA